MKIRFGTGIEGNIRDAAGEDGKKKFIWELSTWGKRVTEGLADTEKEAKDGAWKAFRLMQENVAPGREARAVAKMKLKGMLDKRPYIVCHVADLYLTIPGVKEADILDDAEQGEKAWQKKDSKEARRKLPTHHLSLKPFAAAKKVIDIFKSLNLVRTDGESGDRDVRPLRAWAAKTIGGDFAKKMAEEEADDE